MFSSCLNHHLLKSLRKVLGLRQLNTTEELHLSLFLSLFGAAGTTSPFILFSADPPPSPSRPSHISISLQPQCLCRRQAITAVCNSFLRMENLTMTRWRGILAQKKNPTCSKLFNSVFIHSASSSSPHSASVTGRRRSEIQVTARRGAENLHHAGKTCCIRPIWSRACRVLD